MNRLSKDISSIDTEAAESELPVWVMSGRARY